ncbi:MAG: hypothetical protein KGI04_03005 [Candidatus Micrarchaeota archaeon]|nr:hypothetical protein [Candidatus Micrarchaeota archaeon]
MSSFREQYAGVSHGSIVYAGASISVRPKDPSRFAEGASSDIYLSIDDGAKPKQNLHIFPKEGNGMDRKRDLFRLFNMIKREDIEGSVGAIDAADVTITYSSKDRLKYHSSFKEMLSDQDCVRDGKPHEGTRFELFEVPIPDAAQVVATLFAFYRESNDSTGEAATVRLALVPLPRK